MPTPLLEPMPELFTCSERLTLNFTEITEADRYKNIQQYMNEQERLGKDPRNALHRQAFNETVLSKTGARYLIGRYGEDRMDMLKGSHIADAGRTFHLAVDTFSITQEPVFAPCDGEIVVSAYEPDLHNYGNYIILRPDDKSLPYIFFGHLASGIRTVGRVHANEQIGRLGSFERLENGGWSIHLHLQLLTELPPEDETPIGYSTLTDLHKNKQRFPDPQSIFPDWIVRR